MGLFSAAIAACGSAYSTNSVGWIFALALLTEMQDCLIKPNLVAYSSAIGACINCHQPSRALQLKSVAEKQSIRFDNMFYKMSISSLARSSMWQHAFMLLRS